jgi:hypothetical protein
MKLTILTEEESSQLREKELQTKRLWTREQIVDEAKLFRAMPDMGNTKYIVGEENWIGFFKWLESNEAREVWNESPYILTLAKYYTNK